MVATENMFTVGRAANDQSNTVIVKLEKGTHLQCSSHSSYTSVEVSLQVGRNPLELRRDPLKVVAESPTDLS